MVYSTLPFDALCLHYSLSKLSVYSTLCSCTAVVVWVWEWEWERRGSTRKKDNELILEIPFLFQLNHFDMGMKAQIWYHSSDRWALGICLVALNCWNCPFLRSLVSSLIQCSHAVTMRDLWPAYPKKQRLCLFHSTFVTMDMTMTYQTNCDAQLHMIFGMLYRMIFFPPSITLSLSQRGARIKAIRTKARIRSFAEMKK